jgi:hypothetical protein
VAFGGVAFEEMPGRPSLFEEHVLQAHRSVVFRGTDLRISAAIFRNPELLPRESVLSCRYVWKDILSYPWSGRHINELELKAVLNVVRWRTRSAEAISGRTLHVSDSQVCMGVLPHARSGSRPLHAVVRKLNSLVLAGSLYPVYGYMDTHQNAADAPSRRFDVMQGSRP